jgi:hypothetical protein
MVNSPPMARRSQKAKTGKKPVKEAVPTVEELRAEIRRWQQDFDRYSQSGAQPEREAWCSREIRRLQMLLKNHYGVEQ